MKPMICFLLLISALGCTNSARILDQFSDPQLPVATTVPPGFPQPNNPTDIPPPVVETPPEVPVAPTDVVPPVADPEPIVPPVGVSPPQIPGNPADDLPPVVSPVVATTTTATAATTPADDLPPVVPPVVATTNVAAAGTAPEGAIVPPVEGPVATGPPTGGPAKPTIDFFMHDVLGGSQASGRVVTGIVATSDSSNIPFSKANNQAFPVSGGVPLFNNQVNNLVNNNNAPLLTAMNSQQLQQQQQQQQQQSSTVFQNAGNNNNVINGGSSQPFVTAGQLPQGASLQELMFGTITVIDDQITEGHELGTSIIGSAQGFYLASSLDGESHTMVWTALFHGEHGSDGTISFFGVHRPAAPVSYVAVIGGTGMYENAKGYASIESLPQVDQHTTDGVETIVHISVYLS